MFACSYSIVRLGAKLIEVFLKLEKLYPEITIEWLPYMVCKW
jgi:hypothetical protein